MSLEIDLIPMLSDNYAYLLRDRATGARAIVDAGEAAPALAALARLNPQGGGAPARLDLILNTHHHGDHIGGNAGLMAATDASLLGPAADRDRIPGLDRGLGDGDQIVLGRVRGQVIAVPGHTSGHIAFWFPDDLALFCGDTLFALGCGRLFEGSPAEMWHSLCRLRALPEATRVYCGHEYTEANLRFVESIDPDNPDLIARAAWIRRERAQGRPTIPSRIGLERVTNPFLRADDPGLAAAIGLPGADPVTVFAAIRAQKDQFR